MNEENLSANVKDDYRDLTTGSIVKKLMLFALPIIAGNIVQQLYNVVDTIVVGNFVGPQAIAAVSVAWPAMMVFNCLFMGLGMGSNIIVAQKRGAGDSEELTKAITSTMALTIYGGTIITILGLIFGKQILVLLNTPADILEDANTYMMIIFIGTVGNMMYNCCNGLVRGMGDSRWDFIALLISSLTNVVLDLLFVAVFHWDVAGAAIATVLGQGLSCVLCIIRMCRSGEDPKLDFRKLKFDGPILKEILVNGLPTGIQNSVISIGNMTIQGNINMFDIAHEGGLGLVIAGQGAYTKIEGFVFLPITCMSMSLPTFISQNLGAKQYDRAKKGAVFGILCGVILAELLGVVMHFGADLAVGFFTDAPVAIRYGSIHARTVCWFYCLLAFSHCASGVLRGCGKSAIPMISMLSFWCVFRVIYVTVAIRLIPEYSTIAWAYPITWTLSSILLAVVLLKSDWIHGLEKQRSGVRRI